ncbi:unnamed protein product [Pleuronectes platessa]|uniref:Uncharacterized protein n=1 Tax=Pleuronectes platessa TaxID=8262 RepID=A0A9N7YPG3_PLEPL|nr:unnamed protein product [Pleuronectes platessa]
MEPDLHVSTPKTPKEPTGESALLSGQTETTPLPQQLTAGPACLLSTWGSGGAMHGPPPLGPPHLDPAMGQGFSCLRPVQPPRGALRVFSCSVDPAQFTNFISFTVLPLPSSSTNTSVQPQKERMWGQFTDNGDVF